MTGVIVVITWGILIFPTTTREGLNYVVTRRTIPLYAKLIHFASRDLELRELARDVTKGCRTEEEKVMALFRWVTTDLTWPPPEGLPVVDDHVSYVVIRRYATSDQVHDVLTVLCEYAGMRAFWKRCTIPASDHQLLLSFVKVDGAWCVLDPVHRIAFTDPRGRLVPIEELAKHPEWVDPIFASVPWKGPRPNQYLAELVPFQEPRMTRGELQRPFHRVVAEVKARVRGVPVRGDY